MLFGSKAVFALTISAALITSCSKDDQNYKRSSVPSPTTTTEPVSSTTESAISASVTTTPRYLYLKTGTPQTISGKTNIVIENLRFEKAPGVVLKISNSSNITIRNCFFGRSGAEAIVLEGCSNVRVEKNLFTYNTTGVYAASSKTIKVINNQFVNVRKRADGARGQFVQFNNVTGAGNEISGNRGENFAGQSNPEDLINLFKTSGTAASPVLIKSNMFRGGGPSASGGGIIAGDYSGSYIAINGNTLLNPGQYGIAIAGGNNNVVTNNKIFSKQFTWSNIALYIWMQAGSTSCTNNVIKSNRATWTNKNGISNVAWNAGNCSGTTWEKPTPITEAELNVPAHLISFVTAAELTQLRSR